MAKIGQNDHNNPYIESTAIPSEYTYATRMQCTFYTKYVLSLMQQRMQNGHNNHFATTKSYPT